MTRLNLLLPAAALASLAAAAPNGDWPGFCPSSCVSTVTVTSSILVPTCPPPFSTHPTTLTTTTTPCKQTTTTSKPSTTPSTTHTDPSTWPSTTRATTPSTSPSSTTRATTPSTTSSHPTAIIQTTTGTTSSSSTTRASTTSPSTTLSTTSSHPTVVSQTPTGTTSSSSTTRASTTSPSTTLSTTSSHPTVISQTPTGTTSSSSTTRASTTSPSTTLSTTSSHPTVISQTPTGTTSSSSTSACATAIEDGTYCGFINPEDPCAPQPDGYGPVPTPDTVSAFLAYPAFSAMASAAPLVVDSDEANIEYVQTFSDLQASTSATNYLGSHNLMAYDVAGCAAYCDNTTSCIGFNLFVERDPSLNPTNNDSTAPTVWGYYCPNPASITNFQCTLWGSVVDESTATNQGGWREQFEVVIAGSVGYTQVGIN